jgi:alkyl hydroperoxide reductase subunit AhpF
LTARGVLFHERGLTEPLLQADLAEPRAVGRDQRALAEFGPEVSRVRVSDHFARIATRDQMHGLIQTDADISEVLMRALIHRRSQLVAQGIGDVMVIGSGKSSASSAATTSLSENMSRYLIRRIEETATIQVRTRTEIVALEGNGHLERVHWRDGTGAVTSHDIKHVFLMTGAEANASWLNGRVVLDEKGFIKTGPDLTQKDLAAARWPLDRSPYVLETSRPGVFAVGDVRCGNIKRVASAVGEGSIAVSFVHRALAE